MMTFFDQFSLISFAQLSLAFFRAVSALAANLSAPFLSQFKKSFPSMILNAVGSTPATLPVVARLPAQ
jgi:hypothetical protein